MVAHTVHRSIDTKLHLLPQHATSSPQSKGPVKQPLSIHKLGLELRQCSSTRLLSGNILQLIQHKGKSPPRQFIF